MEERTGGLEQRGGQRKVGAACFLKLLRLNVMDRKLYEPAAKTQIPLGGKLPQNEPPFSELPAGGAAGDTLSLKEMSDFKDSLF